jgi:hypothetical protein
LIFSLVFPPRLRALITGLGSLSVRPPNDNEQLDVLIFVSEQPLP